MTDALREAAWDAFWKLDRWPEHDSGWQEASSIVAKLRTALQEPAPVVARELLDELAFRLDNLHCMVKGECPSLLNEDSGGSAHEDMGIENALADYRAYAAQAPVEPAPVVQPEPPEDPTQVIEGLRVAAGVCHLAADRITNLRAALYSAAPSQLVEDAARLDWVCRNISGKAWREAGVTYSSGSPFDMRCAIDAAMSIAKGVES